MHVQYIATSHAEISLSKESKAKQTSLLNSYVSPLPSDTIYLLLKTKTTKERKILFTKKEDFLF